MWADGDGGKVGRTCLKTPEEDNEAIDCRDLGQVFEHERPLPHPAQDQPQ
jgi:hypothetical protein